MEKGFDFETEEIVLGRVSSQQKNMEKRQQVI